MRSLAAGNAGAAQQLLPVVYDELRQLAERMMQGERRDHTLQPTALISEAFLRLAGGDRSFESDLHFTRVAARAMRRVLVDHARARNADKRGGDRRRVTLDEELFEIAADGERMLAVDDALARLDQVDPQLAQIVELRFFGGATHDEIARALSTSVRTIERGWRLARAWLMRAIGDRQP